MINIHKKLSNKKESKGKEEKLINQLIPEYLNNDNDCLFV